MQRRTCTCSAILVPIQRRTVTIAARSLERSRMFRSTRFMAHLAAALASEAATKASRVLVVVATARTMEAEAIGLAAAALATSEIIKALTENGVGQRIVRAGAGELDAVCETAYRIFWIWCTGLCLFQVAAALCLWLWSGSVLVPALIALLAVEYLFMPGGLVQCALAMRERRLSAVAGIAAGQVVGANLVTVVLAVCWASPLALILPKVVTAPFWLIAMRHLRPWRRRGAGFAPLRPFVTFGGAVLGIEALKALRLHADKLVIGGIAGAEALGIWFFAANAGFGLAISFGNAFSQVLFPHLCASDDRERMLLRSTAIALAIVGPLVVAQALLAPVYVPLLFGARWLEVAELVSVLCLAAIPALAWSACAQYLRATDRATTELVVSFALAAAILAATALFAPVGLLTTAWAVLGVTVLVQGCACALVMVPLLSRPSATKAEV